MKDSFESDSDQEHWGEKTCVITRHKDLYIVR